MLATVGNQRDHGLRFEWGPTGADAVIPGVDVAVVIDALSFTTTVTVAADHGILVWPYHWGDRRAAEFAAERGATLAVGRSVVGPGKVSLSPASVRAARGVQRLVLPSPNGSTICARIAGAGCRVVAAAFRNRRAVAEWLLARRGDHPGFTAAVIAAGERWPDGTLRPAVEDLWGAGALVEALVRGGWPAASPEALAAAASFRAIENDVGTALVDCASGQELIELGFADDVSVAGELDRSDSVPLLVDGAFRSTR